MVQAKSTSIAWASVNDRGSGRRPHRQHAPGRNGCHFSVSLIRYLAVFRLNGTQFGSFGHSSLAQPPVRAARTLQRIVFCRQLILFVIATRRRLMEPLLKLLSSLVIATEAAAHRQSSN